MKLNFSTVLLLCLICLTCILQVEGRRCDPIKSVKIAGVVRNGGKPHRPKPGNFCSYNFYDVKQTDKDCVTYKNDKGEVFCNALFICNCKYKYCCD
jgi:hypothetical protein